MSIKAIVWDIGGVILDDPKVGDFWGHKAGTKELRREFGSNKISLADFVSRGARLLGKSEETFLELYKENYFKIEPIREVYDLYMKIKIDQYILSDTNLLHMNFIKKKYSEMLNISKKRYFSVEIGMRKDNQEVFEHVLKDLRLKAEEVLFIDNKKENVAFAKSLNFSTIHFTDFKNLKKELSDMGVNV